MEDVSTDDGHSSSGGAGRSAWLFLVAAIVLEVAGSLSLKGALDVPALYAVVALGYLGAFAFLALTLGAGLPLGVAYGIWGATGVALTAVLSALIFDESLTPLMAVGIAVIIAGVLCVEMGSQRARAQAVEVE
ncbi:DMT family transporter [Dietzia alimentaria]|uniref:DMT family transporter n=1 Tax=Dietzia alimentaria TaxID=665550 RepID=UPI00029A17B4|nr:SMR family transporter [Dietzia alimentaria]